MPNETWKQCERAIAHRLAGSRAGNRGTASPDVQTPWASVEVKTRQTLPRWLLDAMRQARVNAWGDRLPLLILHETGARHDDDLCILRLADFEAWFGDLGYGTLNDTKPVP